MSFDAHKNFIISTIATAPSPSNSGTGLVVNTGDGAIFPVAPFNCVVWPVSGLPTRNNAEIIRVVSLTADSFTITRTQENTSARSIQTGDRISLAATAKIFTDLETKLVQGFYGFGSPVGVVFPTSDVAIYVNLSASSFTLWASGGWL